MYPILEFIYKPNYNLRIVYFLCIYTYTSVSFSDEIFCLLKFDNIDKKFHNYSTTI